MKTVNPWKNERTDCKQTAPDLTTKSSLKYFGQSCYNLDEKCTCTGSGVYEYMNPLSAPDDTVLESWELCGQSSWQTWSQDARLRGYSHKFPASWQAYT